MRQIVYRSTPAATLGEADLVRLLAQARTNNAIDGITGLLYASDELFVQAIEGPEESVDMLMERILADDRHRDIDVISRRTIEEREFGSWSMALSIARNHHREVHERLERALRYAAPVVREAFAGSIALQTTD